MTKTLDLEIKYFQALAKRVDLDKGARAVLRRALTSEAKQQIEQYSILLPLLPKDVTGPKPKSKVPFSRHETWILCGSLFALYPQETLWHNPESHWQGFGWSCRQLEAKTTTNGVERRFKLLLEQEEDFTEPLIHLFRWIRDNSVPVDYPRLLSDLCQFYHPDRYIQDRWMQQFWSRAAVTD